MVNVVFSRVIGNGFVSYFSTAVNSPFRPAGARHEREQLKPHPYSSVLL